MSMVVLLGSAGVARADTGNPLDPVIKQLTDAVQGGAQQLQQNVPSAPAQQQANQPSQDAPDPPASDGDSPGHETTNPKAPDHSSSTVGKGELLPGKTGSTPLSAEGGSGTSTINDDGSSKADATLLAVGGIEIYGSHASSGGANDAAGPADQACTSSGGAVCPLQAQSHASQSAAGSDSSTKTSLASLCLEPPSGLTFPPPAASAGCSKGLDVEAVSSESTMHRDASTGETSGSTKSSLASVCAPTSSPLPIGLPAGTTPCLKTVTSDGTADSNGTATRHSSVADFFGQSTPLSEPQGTPDALCNLTSPIALPGLPTATKGLCGYVNQGETYLAPGLAGVSQTALDGNLLGLATLQAGHSEVLVHNAGAPAVVSPPVVAPPVVSTPVHHAKQHASVAAAVAGVLPHTGGIWSGWLAIGLLALAFGCAMTAWDVRRGRVAAAG